MIITSCNSPCSSGAQELVTVLSLFRALAGDVAILMAVITATASAATASTSTSESTAASTTTSSTAVTTAGTIDFDFLSIDYLSIECFASFVGASILGHSHKSIALFRDVDIGNFTASGEFVLQYVPGTPGVDAINKKLCHFV